MVQQQTENFMDYVRYLSDKNDGFMFPTHDLEEAAIVMAEILRHAKREVCIYEDRLDGDISDKHNVFHTELLEFLQSGKKLRLVVKNEEYQNSRIYKDLVETYSEQFEGKVELYIASEAFLKNMSSILKNDVNFMVSDQDSNAFRLELAERPLDKNKVDAMCSFNNSNISERLRNAFDCEYSTCKSFTESLIHSL